MSPIPEVSCSCISVTTKTSRDEAIEKSLLTTVELSERIFKKITEDNSTSPADDSQSVSTLLAPAVTISSRSSEVMN